MPPSRSTPAIDDNAPIGERDQPGHEFHNTVALQQGILFHTAFEPGSGVDIVQVVIDWPEPLNTATMTTAWQNAAQRHPALRTGFVWPAPSAAPIQQVHHEARVPVHCHQWSAKVTPERIAGFLSTDRVREFDPATPPLLRVSLLTHAADQHTVIISLQHAILDGRGLLHLLREVFTEYTAIQQNIPFIAPDRRPFEDFAA